MKTALLPLLFILFLFSCSKEDPEEMQDYSTQNEAEIQAYLQANNLNPIKSNSGLYYIIDNPGTGRQPNSGSTVTVNYKGYLLNGTVFDQGTATFNLQTVIPGWTEGITYFKEGGSGKLIIPAVLGYNNRPQPNIPVGSVLVFDITLISVN